MPAIFHHYGSTTQAGNVRLGLGENVLVGQLRVEGGREGRRGEWRECCCPERETHQKDTPHSPLSIHLPICPSIHSSTQKTYVTFTRRSGRLADEERGEARGRIGTSSSSSSSSSRASRHQASALPAAGGSKEGEGFRAAQHQEKEEGGKEAEVGGGGRTRHDDDGRGLLLVVLLCGGGKEAGR